MNEKTLELSLPIAYTVSGTPYGCRTPRQAVVIELLPFQIRSVGGDEAPVVVRWKQDHRHNGIWIEGGEYDGIQECRSFGGRFYRTVMDGSSMPPAIDAFERSFAKAAFCGGFPSRFGPWWPNMTRIPLAAAFRAEVKWPDLAQALSALDEGRLRPARGVRDDSEVVAAEAADAYSDTLLIVDGKIWSSIEAEPTWRVTLHQSSVPRVAVSVMAKPYDSGDFAFRADRVEQAWSLAIELGARLNVNPLGPFGNAEILRPDLLRDEVVVLCDSMLASFKYSARSRTSGCGLEDQWEWCTPEAVALGTTLLATANRRGGLDLYDALEAFDVAERLMLTLQDKKKNMHEILFMNLGYTFHKVDYFLETTKIGRPELFVSDEEHDLIAACFD